MNTPSVWMGLCALIFGSFPASASTGWSDFEPSFSTNPCPDGALACTLRSGPVEPGLTVDSSGFPMPSGDRISFHTLQPSAVFSPFVVPQYERESVRVAASTPPPPPASSLPRERKIKPRSDKPERKVAEVKPSSVCEELTALEPAALLGKLVDAQIECLEGRFASTEVQTDRDRVSRVLMANAWGRGDQPGWRRLAKRHLLEVSRADPDLCFKYSRVLSKASQPEGVIYWSDVAMENRHIWTPPTYGNRVNELHRLRTKAAYDLWREAEAAAAEGGASREAADLARGQAKVSARAWLQFAAASNHDSTTALRTCISAGGTREYCGV